MAITEPRELAWPGYPAVQSGLSSLIFVTDNRAADWGLGSLTPHVRSRLGTWEPDTSREI